MQGLNVTLLCPLGVLTRSVNTRGMWILITILSLAQFVSCFSPWQFYKHIITNGGL